MLPTVESEPLTTRIDTPRVSRRSHPGIFAAILKFGFLKKKMTTNISIETIALNKLKVDLSHIVSKCLTVIRIPKVFEFLS